LSTSILKPIGIRGAWRIASRTRAPGGSCRPQDDPKAVAGAARIAAVAYREGASPKAKSLAAVAIDSSVLGAATKPRKFLEPRCRCSKYRSLKSRLINLVVSASSRGPNRHFQFARFNLPVENNIEIAKNPGSPSTRSDRISLCTTGIVPKPIER
jgi:hypothetical protein